MATESVTCWFDSTLRARYKGPRKAQRREHVGSKQIMKEVKFVSLIHMGVLLYIYCAYICYTYSTQFKYSLWFSSGLMGRSVHSSPDSKCSGKSSEVLQENRVWERWVGTTRDEIPGLRSVSGLRWSGVVSVILSWGGAYWGHETDCGGSVAWLERNQIDVWLGGSRISITDFYIYIRARLIWGN